MPFLAGRRKERFQELHGAPFQAPEREVYGGRGRLGGGRLQVLQDGGRKEL